MGFLFYWLYNKIKSNKGGFRVKSGDLSDPNNYRPIILVSIMSKIFTSILTSRLLSWAEDEEKLIDNQFGFRPGRSTAIFVLHGIILHILQNKQKVYSVFVDFRKAFDKVVRRLLWYKLLKSGLSNKFISIIKAVYASVRLRIRSEGDFPKHLTIFLVLNKENHFHLCYSYFSLTISLPIFKLMPMTFLI